VNYMEEKINELTKEEIWTIAEAINNSDGIMPSNYLKELIEKSKKEGLTNEELLEKLKEHYIETDNRQQYRP